MKAHRHRKLGFQEISIVDLRGATPFEAEEGFRFNLNALIDPPTRVVQMNGKVATQRGLRGFRGLEEKPDTIIYQPGCETDTAGNNLHGTSEPKEKFRSPTYGSLVTRRSLVKEEDRQIAELSITHENSVAVAVCMALKDQGENVHHEAEPIIDDGSGDPVHEPVWGDRGFLTQDGG